MATSNDQQATTVGGYPLAQAHPTYAANVDRWTKLNHARQGTGGFADASYLVGHAREWLDHASENPTQPTKKLRSRRRLARYENLAGTIVETLLAALFRECPTRTITNGSAESGSYLQWVEHAGMHSRHIDDELKDATDAALTFGHVFITLGLPMRDAAPVSMADQLTLPPYLSLYTPLDVPDWLTDERGQLVAVKLIEAVPRTSFDSAVEIQTYQTREITTTTWTVRSANGDVISQGEHNFGRLQVVVLYGRRSPLGGLIGDSVLGDPKIHIDFYNLTSEKRELYRSQVFGQLCVPLGTGPGAVPVEEARNLLGSGSGTENVLFVPEMAAFISPDGGNLQRYDEERAHLVRTMYRLAALSWDSDSKDAESEGSRKVKREDLNQRLSSHADELERAEYQIADLFYRWRFGSDKGPGQLTADGLKLAWPDNFDPTPYATLLEEAVASTALELPPTAKRELIRQHVAKLLPDLPADVRTKIDAELDAMTSATQLESFKGDAIRGRMNAPFDDGL